MLTATGAPELPRMLALQVAVGSHCSGSMHQGMVKPKLSMAEWVLAKTRSVGSLQRYEGDPLLDTAAHPSVAAVELVRLCGDSLPRVVVIHIHVVGCLRCVAHLTPIDKVLEQQLQDTGVSPLQDSLILGLLRDCHLALDC